SPTRLHPAAEVAVGSAPRTARPKAGCSRHRVVEVAGVSALLRVGAAEASGHPPAAGAVAAGSGYQAEEARPAAARRLGAARALVARLPVRVLWILRTRALGHFISPCCC